MRVISLQPPWTWLVSNQYKRIENRTWMCASVTGPVLVHASQSWDSINFPVDRSTGRWHAKLSLPFPTEMPPLVGDYPRGGIVGKINISHYVTESQDPWFWGPYGWVIKDAQVLPFVACKGFQRFWFATPEQLEQLGLQGKDTCLVCGSNFMANTNPVICDQCASRLDKQKKTQLARFYWHQPPRIQEILRPILGLGVSYNGEK